MEDLAGGYGKVRRRIEERILEGLMTGCHGSNTIVATKYWKRLPMLDLRNWELSCPFKAAASNWQIYSDSHTLSVRHSTV